MILLCLIGRKETYGYEIITELNNSASVLGYAKEGTIYPILYRLQEAELIKCRSRSQSAFDRRAPPEHLSTRIQSPASNDGSIESDGILKEVTTNTCNTISITTSRHRQNNTFVIPFNHFFNCSRSFIPSISYFASPLIFNTNGEVSALQYTVIVLSKCSGCSAL